MSHEKEQLIDLPRLRRLTLVEAAEFLALSRSKELIHLQPRFQARGG